VFLDRAAAISHALNRRDNPSSPASVNTGAPYRIVSPGQDVAISVDNTDSSPDAQVPIVPWAISQPIAPGNPVLVLNSDVGINGVEQLLQSLKQSSGSIIDPAIPAASASEPALTSLAPQTHVRGPTSPIPLDGASANAAFRQNKRGLHRLLKSATHRALIIDATDSTATAAVPGKLMPTSSSSSSSSSCSSSIGDSSAPIDFTTSANGPVVNLGDGVAGLEKLLTSLHLAPGVNTNAANVNSNAAPSNALPSLAASSTTPSSKL